MDPSKCNYCHNQSCQLCKDLTAGISNCASCNRKFSEDHARDHLCIHEQQCPLCWSDDWCTGCDDAAHRCDSCTSRIAEFERFDAGMHTPDRTPSV